jgi:general secretion pathway protein D
MIPVGPPKYQVQLIMDSRVTNNILKLKPEYVKIEEADLARLAAQDGLFITTTIKVQNMTDLRNARNALTKIVTGQNIGNVTEVPAARAFVVTDFAPNVVAIYRLLQEMDVKPRGKEITSEYLSLRHANADEVEPILTDLFTGRERIGQRQPQAQGQGPDVEEDPEPRIISDPRTNQIIIYGIQSDIDEIKKVVEHIDVPIWITNDRVRVIRLKNLEAEETAEVLTTLIEAATIFGTDAGAGTGRPSGGRVQPQGGQANAQPSIGQEEKPAVVADIKSNSLIIAGTQRQFEELQRVIKEIDIKKDQVLIEAALIELSLDDAYRLSLELGLADDNGLVNDDAASGFGFTSFGLNRFVDKDGDTFFTDRIPGFVDAGGAAPTGLVGGIFAFGQVPLIFSALNTVSQSRILQLPSIVTANNEEAVIVVKEEQATTTSSTTTGGVTSGGFGGFEDAGTTLAISPHISDENFLLLNINLTVSAFQGEPRELASGDVIPADKLSRQIITAVTVPDRHTVVLGGLMGTSQRSTVDKTPILGDMPILGNLFRGTTRSERNTSLFLFVTPTIMAGNDRGFEVYDRESCRRKQKADELIGYTEIYNSHFIDCGQDPASGVWSVPQAGCVQGSGSASDRLEQIGLLEATRFSGVSRERLEAERNARRDALRGSKPAAPAGVAPAGGRTMSR